MTEKAGRVPIALTIAGSDSGGGAGIQADLKTFAALQVYGASVITALTAQNTLGVSQVHDPPVPFIVAQLDAVLSDLSVDAVKIGMLSRAEVIAAVAERLRSGGLSRVVLDPVMVAKGGASLLRADALAALREQLLPLSLVLTPNLPEAAALLGWPVEQVLADVPRALESLLGLGPRSVVLKGGHAGGQRSDDWFSDGSQVVQLPARRVDTRHTHGTGCTFSAAIAAGLAHGLELKLAVQLAKDYVTSAIAAAGELSVGRGQGPVHHFFALWPADG